MSFGNFICDLSFGKIVQNFNLGQQRTESSDLSFGKTVQNFKGNKEQKPQSRDKLQKFKYV